MGHGNLFNCRLCLASLHEFHSTPEALNTFFPVSAAGRRGGGRVLRNLIPGHIVIHGAGVILAATMLTEEFYFAEIGGLVPLAKLLARLIIVVGIERLVMVGLTPDVHGP